MTTGEIVWPDGWQVEVAPLPRGTRGLTLYRERRSIIAPDLHPWQRRATETHEAIHAHDGPVPAWMEAREERRVNRATARRLIALPDLIHALQVTADAHVAAEMLEVPVPMVWSRLNGLHPAERAAVRRAVDHHHP